jgi:hypothetical protein
MALSEHELGEHGKQRSYAADIEVQSFYVSYSGVKRYRNPCEVHTEAWL